MPSRRTSRHAKVFAMAMEIGPDEAGEMKQMNLSGDNFYYYRGAEFDYYRKFLDGYNEAVGRMLEAGMNAILTARAGGDAAPHLKQLDGIPAEYGVVMDRLSLLRIKLPDRWVILEAAEAILENSAAELVAQQRAAEARVQGEEKKFNNPGNAFAGNGEASAPSNRAAEEQASFRRTIDVIMNSEGTGTVSQRIAGHLKAYGGDLVSSVDVIAKAGTVDAGTVGGVEIAGMHEAAGIQENLGLWEALQRRDEIESLSTQLQALTGQGSTVLNLGSGTTVSPEVDFYAIPSSALQKLIDIVKATPGDIWQDWQGMIDDVHGALQGVQEFLAARAEAERLAALLSFRNPVERDGHLAAFAFLKSAQSLVDGAQMITPQTPVGVFAIASIEGAAPTIARTIGIIISKGASLASPFIEPVLQALRTRGLLAADEVVNAELNAMRLAGKPQVGLIETMGERMGGVRRIVMEESLQSHLMLEHIGRTDAEIFARSVESGLKGVSSYSDSAITADVLNAIEKQFGAESRSWLSTARAGETIKFDIDFGRTVGRGVLKGATSVADVQNWSVGRMVFYKGTDGALHLYTGYPIPYLNF